MKVKIEPPSWQSTPPANMTIFLPPLHPQILLPEIPRLLRTDDLVDLRIVDVRLQIAVVAVPTQILLAPMQPVPGRLHLRDRFPQEVRQAALQITPVSRQASAAVSCNATK